MCKNFINKKKPENGLNLMVLGLLLFFLPFPVRPHTGVIDFLVFVAPLLARRVAFILVRPVVSAALLSRLLAVIPGPFTAFFVVFGFVP